MKKIQLIAIAILSLGAVSCMSISGLTHAGDGATITNNHTAEHTQAK